MSDIIKFEVDQPVEVALRYPEPKVFASQFAGGDDRHMYSTTDGRVMYLSPLASARVQALHLSQGECFFICKVKRGRLTEFAVSREPMQTAGPRLSHKKNLPPVKSNLPERLYYRPEEQLSPSAEASLEQQLQASIQMVERRKAMTAGEYESAPVCEPRQSFPVSVLPPARLQNVQTTSGSVNPNKPAVPVKIPMDRAVVDAVRMVQNAMKECGEQWSDQARQDLVSTILISANRCDWLTMWKGDAK